MTKAYTFKNEGDVKKRVKAILDQYKWFWWMTPANGFGKSGISDISALKDGVYMAIETKFGSNKPTAMQKGYLSSVQSQGAFAFVVNDHNIGWFDVFMQAFTRSVEAKKKNTEPLDEDGAAMLNAIHAMTQDY